MKKSILLLLLCLVANLLPAQTEKELYILHTNDMHSRIEPFAPYYPDSVLAGKGGVVRRATFIA